MEGKCNVREPEGHLKMIVEQTAVNQHNYKTGTCTEIDFAELIEQIKIK